MIQMKGYFLRVIMARLDQAKDYPILANTLVGLIFSPNPDHRPESQSLAQTICKTFSHF